MPYKDSAANRAAQLRYRATKKGREKSKAWRDANPAILRRAYIKSNLKRFYGLTFEARDAMFEQQGYKCAVCGAQEPGNKNGHWYIDHDHARKDPHARGILCLGCNTALGCVKDSIPTLQAAIKYLEKHLGSP